VALAVMGEHMIRYTGEVVLPRLDLALAQVEREAAAAPRLRAAAGRAGVSGRATGA